MLTVDEALAEIFNAVKPNLAVPLPIDNVLDLVLASDIASDLDSPPWDKSMVDGYALRTADLSDGFARLKVIEEVRAGNIAKCQVGPGEATRIMTGAPLPMGADAVVMVERTTLVTTTPSALDGAGEQVEINDARCKLGQNILRRGCSMRAGETVLARGTILRPVEIGLLCELGRAAVPAHPAVRVAIVSTGDELVEVDRTPGPGQIRNSNGAMLAACVTRAGAVATNLGIVRDEPEQLKAGIRKALEADLVVLSGGVSAGVVDLVPAVLAELGVERIFHKVRIKPGKPLWFGMARQDGEGKPVFGLPGNPVSSLVGFELFVRPAIEKLSGRDCPSRSPETAELTDEFTHRGDRPTYAPACISSSPSGLRAAPVRWTGSADLRGLAAANGLIAFPAGDAVYPAGTVVKIHRL